MREALTFTAAIKRQRDDEQDGKGVCAPVGVSRIMPHALANAGVVGSNRRLRCLTTAARLTVTPNEDPKHGKALIPETGRHAH
jgi:hypothetical protein